MATALSPLNPNARRNVMVSSKLHLQNGPIDLIIQAWGEPKAVKHSLRKTELRFATILDELVSELVQLRSPWHAETEFQTPVAQRMQSAVTPFAYNRFVTPMAAVAGAVADEILDVLNAAANLDKAYVNNGGDIAVFVSPGETLAIGLVDDPDPLVGGDLLTGTAHLEDCHGVGGIATSGRHGRSFSRGIADAVTVAAKSAASADVAATLLANAVDVSSPSVTRQPAVDLDPDCDLGMRLVTTNVGNLSDKEIETALDSGQNAAQDYCDKNMIVAALLRLKGQSRAAGTHRRILSVPAIRPEKC